MLQPEHNGRDGSALPTYLARLAEFSELIIFIGLRPTFGGEQLSRRPLGTPAGCKKLFVPPSQIRWISRPPRAASTPAQLARRPRRLDYLAAGRDSCMTNRRNVFAPVLHLPCCKRSALVCSH